MEVDNVNVVNAQRVRGSLAFVPSVAAFLLPLGKCPACWPAYAALLSSTGLGFLFYERYLLPVVAVAVAVALVTLAYGARGRRGYGPFGLAVAGSVVAGTGKFLVLSPILLSVGLGLFVLAAAWNAWPRRQVACAQCAQQDAGSMIHERTK